MSRRVECPPTLYVAVWHDLSIVKPGYTAARRWRAWEASGAQIFIRQEFSSGLRVLDAERALHDFLRHRWSLAFRSKEDSRSLLGRHGGWMETFRVEHLPAVLDAVACIVRTHTAHDATHAWSTFCPACTPTSDARTNGQYGRTYRSPWNTSLTPSDARGRVRPGSVVRP